MQIQEAETALRRMAELQVQLGDYKNNRDEAVLRAQTEYDYKTQPLLAEQDRLWTQLESFYKANRKLIEAGGKRSLECLYGRIGYRKGTGTLAPMKGVKWPDVLASLKRLFARDPNTLTHLVKTKETINKDGVKSRMNAEGLAELGLRIHAPERFFVEAFPDKLKDAAA